MNKETQTENEDGNFHGFFIQDIMNNQGLQGYCMDVYPSMTLFGNKKQSI